MNNRDLLSTSEAANYVGTRPHTLEVWRASGRYKLPFLKVGRLVKYRRADLDAWLESRVVNADAPPAALARGRQ
jgi:excisionase family DNA binding protein